jgi:hypothetical protein
MYPTLHRQLPTINILLLNDTPRLAYVSSLSATRPHSSNPLDRTNSFLRRSKQLVAQKKAALEAADDE